MIYLTYLIYQEDLSDQNEPSGLKAHVESQPANPASQEASQTDGPENQVGSQGVSQLASLDRQVESQVGIQLISFDSQVESQPVSLDSWRAS